MTSGQGTTPSSPADPLEQPSMGTPFNPEAVKNDSGYNVSSNSVNQKMALDAAARPRYDYRQRLVYLNQTTYRATGGGLG